MAKVNVTKKKEEDEGLKTKTLDPQKYQSDHPQYRGKAHPQSKKVTVTTIFTR